MIQPPENCSPDANDNLAALERQASAAWARWCQTVDKVGIEQAAMTGELDKLMDALELDDWDRVDVSKHERKRQLPRVDGPVIATVTPFD